MYEQREINVTWIDRLEELDFNEFTFSVKRGRLARFINTLGNL